MSMLLKIYWRQMAIAVLMTLPLFSLAGIGLYWLIHSTWVWVGFGAMAAASLGASLLAQSLRKEKARLTPVAVVADPSWAPAEKAAWAQIEELAIHAQTYPPQSREEVQELALGTINAVATQLRGQDDLAWSQFTLPEILLATERAACHLREVIKDRVPGSEHITLAQGLLVQRFFATHEGRIKLGWRLYKVGHVAYRLVRACLNPVVAASAEIKGLATDKAMGKGYDLLLGAAARLLVEEVGRAAIDLYSGRLKSKPADVQARLEQAAPEVSAPVPVKVVIVGQTNAGKSSITNALLGEVQSLVSELPATRDFKAYRVGAGAEMGIVVVDTPGLDVTGANQAELLEAMQGADLILWATQASNPARDIDARTLTALRAWHAERPSVRPPPIVLVMTHADRLSPVRSWDPPYDLMRVETPKARTIREALDHVSQTLAVEQELAIPVALPPGGRPYNIDALWGVIHATLEEARFTALDRELKRSGHQGLGRVFTQLASGGRFVVGKLWRDHLNA